MTVRPEDVIRPSTIRHDRPRQRDVEAEIAIAIRFRASLLSVRLALEIQAKCGLIPLSEARQEALDGHRSIAAD